MRRFYGRCGGCVRVEALKLIPSGIAARRMGLAHIEPTIAKANVTVLLQASQNSMNRKYSYVWTNNSITTLFMAISSEPDLRLGRRPIPYGKLGFRPCRV